MKKPEEIEFEINEITSTLRQELSASKEYWKSRRCLIEVENYISDTCSIEYDVPDGENRGEFIRWLRGWVCANIGEMYVDRIRSYRILVGDIGHSRYDYFGRFSKSIRITLKD
jgi:hypothetical protein